MILEYLIDPPSELNSYNWTYTIYVADTSGQPTVFYDKAYDKKDAIEKAQAKLRVLQLKFNSGE